MPFSIAVIRLRPKLEVLIVVLMYGEVDIEHAVREGVTHSHHTPLLLIVYQVTVPTEAETVEL